MSLGSDITALTGNVAPGFEPVRDAFLANFEQRLEIGAAVAVYHHAELVVDLAAGVRDRKSGEPYTRETLQPIFSVTKSVTALAANMSADHGELDFDRPSSCIGLGSVRLENQEYQFVGY